MAAFGNTRKYPDKQPTSFALSGEAVDRLRAAAGASAHLISKINRERPGMALPNEREAGFRFPSLQRSWLDGLVVFGRTRRVYAEHPELLDEVSRPSEPVVREHRPCPTTSCHRSAPRAGLRKRGQETEAYLHCCWSNRGDLHFIRQDCTVPHPAAVKAASSLNSMARRSSEALNWESDPDDRVPPLPVCPVVPPS
jgi:hypothetical protein